MDEGSVTGGKSWSHCLSLTAMLLRAVKGAIDGEAGVGCVLALVIEVPKRYIFTLTFLCIYLVDLTWPLHANICKGAPQCLPHQFVPDLLSRSSHITAHRGQPRQGEGKGHDHSILTWPWLTCPLRVLYLCVSCIRVERTKVCVCVCVILRNLKTVWRTCFLLQYYVNWIIKTHSVKSVSR